MSCSFISIWVDVMLLISEWIIENTSASFAINCWTSHLSPKFTPDKSVLSKSFCWCSLISTGVMSLFLCFSSISVLSLFKLDWTVEISALLSLACKGVMCEICWSLPMIVFLGKIITCFELLMTGLWDYDSYLILQKLWCLQFLTPLIVQFPLFQKALVSDIT